MAAPKGNTNARKEQSRPCRVAASLTVGEHAFMIRKAKGRSASDYIRSLIQKEMQA
jgi:hypothetical protein